MGKLYIGTSGWAYSHWQGIFYPENLPSKDKLKYFSQHFKTAEVNYSFYHLPKPATYQNWYKQTPKDFLFAVKASRFITHIKRIKGAKEAWKTFLKNALYLKEKLGPILFQFPPSFQATGENTKRLEDFLRMLKMNYPGARGGVSLWASSFGDGILAAKRRGIISKHRGSNSIILRYAFEFRHESWCDERTYKLLKRYRVAWVIADSPRYPKAEAITADFVYIRMHGSKVLFTSKYTRQELKILSQKIKKWLKSGLDVYCYFNNDAMGYAIENAEELLKLCGK